MTPSSREKQYTISVGTKVTPDVAEQIRVAAEAAGLNVAEWVRKAVMDAVSGGGDRVVLAEVVALRTAFLTLQKESWRMAGWTDEKLEAMVKAIDKQKFARADAAVLAGRNQ